jgi:hypothetical protein
MNSARVKTILEAASKLPPAKGRALVQAISAKAQDSAMEDWAATLKASMKEPYKPLADALLMAFRSGDEAAMKSALTRISETMPGLALLPATPMVEAILRQFLRTI